MVTQRTEMSNQNEAKHARATRSRRGWSKIHMTTGASSGDFRPIPVVARYSVVPMWVAARRKK